MSLIPFWYIVIAILWAGFFILEGFDFGVGMLHAVIGTDEAGRRAAINTIGPLWDGNEVWLIVAGAAMFAAFPGWYATMFSALNLALVLLLAALIARGLSFEYRGKRDSLHWRRTWDVLLTVSSVLAPLLIGVALGDLVQGLPINSAQNYTGSFWDLLQPYGIFTALYPNVMVSSTNAANNLTAQNTASPAYPLKVMSVVAIILLPVVLIYQAWTYYVFRRRISAAEFQPGEPSPTPVPAGSAQPSPDGAQPSASGPA